MRDLTDTLKAAQEANSIDALVKIVLTRTGQTTRTYTRDRILRRSHPEEPYSQKATVVLDNSDGALTNLALQGFKGVISYGAIGSAGEEYSDCAPLWVIGQRLESSPGKLDCVLSLIGIPNLLATDKASRNYIPDEDDTKTIETLLIEILGATLGCFSHCKAYEVVIDSRDSLINTYKPKDSLRIYKGNSRLAIAKRLLDCTECVMLAKADGQLHIFVPTISGEVYASQYSIESGHTFFSKAYRKALVIPNYIYASSPPHTVPNWVIVTSDPYSGEAKDQADIDKFGARKHTTDWGAGNLESNAECAEYAQIELNRYIALHDPYYEGVATDPVSIAAIGEIRAYWQASFESDDQAKLVAEALLAKLKLNAEMGAADVPINVGTEVYDYIKVAALCAEDVFRVGTIGSLTRHYNAEEAEWRMSFSLGQRPKAVDVLTIIEQEAPYFGRLFVDDLYARDIDAQSLRMTWLDPDGTIDITKIWGAGETFTIDGLPDGEHYARVKTVHLTPEGGLKMDEFVTFDEGYDPTTKETAIHRGATPPEDLTKLWIDTSTELNVVYRYNGVTAQWERASPANLDQLENGVDYARVKKMALNTDGLVLIDQIYTVGGTFGLAKSAALTVDGLVLMDELVDGDYARVKSAGLSAQGLVLLDQVVEGTYGRVYAADLTSHHLHLASTIEDASHKTVTGSEKTGASDAYDVFESKLTAYGLSLWTAISSTRVELTSQGLKGYAGGVIQVEIKASDGKISAGGGSVILDASGVECRGSTSLKLTYYGSYSAYLWTHSTGALCVSAASGYYISLLSDARAQNIRPQTHENLNLGYATFAWYGVVTKNIWRQNEYSYQHLDDIALIRQMRGDPKNPGFIDIASVPEVILDTPPSLVGEYEDQIKKLEAQAPKIEAKHRQLVLDEIKHLKAEAKEIRKREPAKMINVYKEISLTLGAIRQLADRIEALEAKVDLRL